MNSNKKTKKIVWKVNAFRIKAASFRIRCFLPALNLENKGFFSVILEKDEKIENFDGCDVLIFVKSFSKHDYHLAMQAAKKNIPIILDLCDNIFVDNYPSEGVNYFKKMAEISSAVVTTGNVLAEIIRIKLSSKVRVLIIPDQVESPDNTMSILNLTREFRNRRFLIFKYSTLKKASYLLGLFLKFDNYKKILIKIFKIGLNFLCFIKSKLFLKQKKISNIDYQFKRVIWFGNAGGKHSNFGIKSLLLIKLELEKINKLIPIELLVISNNVHLYNELVSPFLLKTSYKTWGLNSIYDDIRAADVTIIPNSKDEFSLVKSPNRAILSLSLGTPVVAHRIDSLNDFSSCIIFDDFSNGILTYINDKSRALSDLKKANFIIKKHYSSKQITELWSHLLLSVVPD
jgi:hypothetical protein